MIGNILWLHQVTIIINCLVHFQLTPLTTPVRDLKLCNNLSNQLPLCNPQAILRLLLLNEWRYTTTIVHSQLCFDIRDLLVELLDIGRDHTQLGDIREIETIVCTLALVRLAPENHGEYLFEKIYEDK